jgi:hypothetical protein
MKNYKEDRVTTSQTMFAGERGVIYFKNDTFCTRGVEFYTDKGAYHGSWESNVATTEQLREIAHGWLHST